MIALHELTALWTIFICFVYASHITGVWLCRKIHYQINCQTFGHVIVRILFLDTDIDIHTQTTNKPHTQYVFFLSAVPQFNYCPNIRFALDLTKIVDSGILCFAHQIKFLIIFVYICPKKTIIISMLTNALEPICKIIKYWLIRWISILRFCHL